MTKEELSELLSEAREHLEHRRYRMALAAANKAYDEIPDDPGVSSFLSLALLENGYTSEALEVANLAVRENKDNPDVYLNRGYLLMRLSIFQGAVEDLDRAIQNHVTLISTAHLHKARALAGMGKYAEAIEEIELAIKSSGKNDENLVRIKNWLTKSIKFEDGKPGGIAKKKRSFLAEGREAYNLKEYWFSLWASEKTLSNLNLKNEHHQAKILKLQSLLAMFRIKEAYDSACSVKKDLKDDFRFDNIYQKILKLYRGKNTYKEKNKDVMTEIFRQTRFEFYENKFFHIYHAKTYDLIENIRAGKRTYLLRFNEDTIRYIGIEIVLDNPFYGNKKVDLEGIAVWYLNNNEVGRHVFNLIIEKDWKIVEFVQSWGTDSPGFWKEGQGKVDIFLDNYLICSRWFLVGQSEVVNFEESEIETEINEIAEKPLTDQPGDAKSGSLKPQESKSLEELLAELDGYTGLQSVKQSMRDFINYLNFINERKKLGLKTQENLSVHSVFVGNPGTGKTTVARLLGKIFKAMGLLRNGHVIEVDRSGLVGQYIGETAQKTNKVIDEAVGGLLFIDEAYSLKKEANQQDFGQEAIEVLIKRMEEAESEFVVIVAGYPEEMNSFINSNPGLKSRFTHFFQFDDYSPDELIEIFKFISSKEEYTLQEEAVVLLKKHFTKLYRKRDKTFGNARLARNYFNDAKINLSRRYLQLPGDERTKETMTTICLEDISALIEGNFGKHVRFDIDEESLSKALNKLNDLTGLSSVKKEINEIVKLARFYSEQGENIQEKFSSHLVFLGNPGTGKTTVARLFGEIYSALGILPRGHLVEIDRQGLVASYVGQTAEKTKAVIDRAMGGTLFVDEAYTLVKFGDNAGGDFGKEALDTLLKRMEDDRGNFSVIVAGYTDEMNKFLKSNPGLQSRFTKKIFFEDYSPDELMTIAQKLWGSKGHLLDDEGVDPLRKYFKWVYKNRDKTFGNARLVRDLVESSLKNQMLRIADIPAAERHEEVLKYILLDDIKDIISYGKSKENVKTENNREALDNYLIELENLAGLDSVKKSVSKLINSLKVAKLRKQRGLKVIPRNLNSVFIGNAGTGKTTMARLLCKIYKELGILEKGHIIEIDRMNLISGYTGQTAVKTNEAVDNAMGGILYINDVSSLSRGITDAGQEALDTISKRIEEDRDKFIVILSGHPYEMKTFLDSNPGIQSRFPNNFIFEDYTPRQMLEIALDMSDKNGYILDEGAWQQLLEIFNKIYSSRDINFGNAHTVKNILYKVIGNQEERILSFLEPNDNDLITITFEDVEKLEPDDF